MVETRVAMLERGMTDIKEKVDKLAIQHDRLDAKFDEKLNSLKQSVEASVAGMREQQKSHKQELSEKMDKVVQNTEVFSLIKDDPAEFLDTWNFLKKMQRRMLVDGESIRRVIYSSVIGGVFLALWYGFKTMLTK
jgi:ElaB/YqjD/DUF883 family membrane-anchored ribosome-binding protein